MRSSIAALALAGLLAAPPAFAQLQLFGQRSNTTPAQPGTPKNAPVPAAAPAARAEATVDRDVFPTASTVPSAAEIDPNAAPTIVLPDDPIEPYLLTRDAGPFMVMAKAFRGAEAERFALALALELRNEYGLPAYIFRLKDIPRNGLIRNIPPTAPRAVDRVRLASPEKDRTYDEAVVLVGNEKTLKDQEALWHRVKKIKPKCIEGMPKLFDWRVGLSKALRTTNPYAAAQDLYPGKLADPFVEGMNKGPHSIYNCPGQFTLQIADFRGRDTLNVEGAQSQGIMGLKRSPLITAHDDAERLAGALAKADEVRKLGQPIYVYHDRTSSRVMIGSFNNPNDPAAVQLRDSLIRLAVDIMDRKAGPNSKARKRGIDTMIVPATALTEVAPLRPQAQ